MRRKSRRPARTRGRVHVPILRGVLSAAFLFGGFACAPTPDPSFRVGVLALYDGDFSAVSGEPTVTAVQLYADSVNAAGGIQVGEERYRLELVIEEHLNQVEDATTAARRLINRERVAALIGPQLSRHAIPVGGIADRAGVPMISPMSSNQQTTEGRRWVFRMATPDEVQASVMAQTAFETAGTRAVGVLFDQSSEYSVSLAEIFERDFTRHGGSVVRRAWSDSSPFDLRPLLLELREARIDGLYLPTIPVATEDILAQVEDVDLHVRLFGGDGWSLSRVAAFSTGEGALSTTQWHYDIPAAENRVFIERYQQAYGRLPHATAVLTRDALDALVRSAEMAGSTEEGALRDALIALPPFEGASGGIDFGPDGSDRLHRVVVSVVQDGIPRLLRTVDRDGAQD